ncbi:hypothetical protein LXA43DRAFT_1176453 [Ganoderma leucocontextum]|nr:hypothetical protein LXA43DRAFT_1176453 [Ganoderma leucocontextum]
MDLSYRSLYHFWEYPSIVLDKEFAFNLDSDVMAAYQQLMRNYRPGDKISLFGFSRGAYIARALAEMIHKVGLVPKKKASWASFAYSLYLRDVDDRWHKSFAKLRKKCDPIKVNIDFVGVWDTVSSVGDVIPRTLPFTRSNTSIRVFRQALALHERWARLQPKFSEFDAQNDQDRTDVQEVWFAGSHCGTFSTPLSVSFSEWAYFFFTLTTDVGGCSFPNRTPHHLGRIPLRWMVRECFWANTGIQFDAEQLRDIGLDPASLYPIVVERPSPLQPRCYHFNTAARRVPTASEEEHDVRDALSPMHDQLAVFAPLWWLMEFNPMRRRIPIGPPSEWRWGSAEAVRMTLPRGFFIPEHHSRFYVHPSVSIRQQAKYLREGRF